MSEAGCKIRNAVALNHFSGLHHSQALLWKISRSTEVIRSLVDEVNEELPSQCRIDMVV